MIGLDSLDAMGNKQSSYDLFVNPSGIQGDILNSAVSGEDVSPDFVWDSAGRVTKNGYQVEMKIPLKSIRFKSGEYVRMGILFWRRISRLGISGSWPDIKPGHGIFNVNATMVYQNLKSPLNLEVLPSITYGNNYSRTSQNKWQKDDLSKDFGANLKYGVSSSITAEATFNPDFSQVESDAFQVEVNQRYPVFYSEKRPFFMEGMDIFDFSIISHGMMITPVHTRRMVDPKWGAKVTGSLGKSSFGILTAGDEFPGYEWEEEINPNQGKLATFGIARAKHSLNGDNYVGVIYSGRKFASGANNVVGSDVQFRLFKNQQTSFSIMASNTNSPENDKSFAGSAINFSHSYFTRALGMAMAFEHYDKDFQMESSFLLRTGINNGWIWISPNFYPDAQKISWLRRICPQIIFASLHDIETDLEDLYFSIATSFYFTKQGNFAIEFQRQKEYWQNISFWQSTVNANGGIQLTNWLRFGGFIRRGDQIYYYDDPPYLGLSNSGGFNFTLQPKSKLKQYFEIYHERFFRHSDNKRIYSINIVNGKTTYQFNKYFFVRANIRYNSYDDKILTDFLASFTFIPGTVLHLGYGSIYEKNEWQQNQWINEGKKFNEMRRSFFFKASYLWRL